MDILDIKTSNIEIELRHPKTDMPMGIHLDLFPFDHAGVKAVRGAWIKKSQAAAKRGKSLTSEEVEEMSVDLTTASIAGWRWEEDVDRGIEQPTMGGDVPEFNKKNLRELMSKDWARSQVDVALGNTADFFTG